MSSALGLGSAESPGACGSVGWKLVFRNEGAWIRSLTLVVDGASRRVCAHASPWSPSYDDKCGFTPMSSALFHHQPIDSVVGFRIGS